MKFANFFTFIIICVLCCTLTGCQTPVSGLLYSNYYLTNLKKSTSADVLGTIEKQGELLSQSQSVIASAGRDEKDRKLWFNMVVFDENKLTAKRKYVFVAEDKGKIYYCRQLRRKLGFDTEMVIDREVLNEPYANENAKTIAVLRRVLENFRDDAGEVRAENHLLDLGAAMVNQTLEAILYRLDQSPALASALSKEAGLDFDHITLGKSKARMLIRDDVVKIKIKVSSIAKSFENQPDVKDM